MNDEHLEHVDGGRGDGAALITGGARRIGACTARGLHARGLHVVIHCHESVAEAGALVSDLNRVREHSASMLCCDLNDSQALAGMSNALAIQLAGQQLQLQVLINNASRFYPTPLAQISQADWDDLFNSNVRAAFFLSQQLAPMLSGNKGSIVNIIDIHAQKPLARHSLYCMAKAALQMMTMSLALELAPRVRVNGVAPGAIMWPEQGRSAPQRQSILEHVPMQRSGNGSDIAAAVVYLALDADYVTGQILAVDGGRSLYR